MPEHARRSFLAGLASLSALSLVRGIFPGSLRAAPIPDGKWDLTWLDRLAGEHKQVFDVGTLDRPLHVVTAYYDAFEDVLGVRPPRLTAVVGIAGAAFPINATNELWTKYELGKRWKVTDPATGGPAVRNVYLERMPAPAGVNVGVKTLQARGAIFWQCNNALKRIAGELATDLGADRDAVYSELAAGLLPGVKLIPAHTMLLGLAQERGCAYEKL